MVRVVALDSDDLAAEAECVHAWLGSRELLGNHAFFERSVMPVVMRNFHDSPPEPDAETRRLIRQLLVTEYLNESQGGLLFQ